jgi:hypothetical protein
VSNHIYLLFCIGIEDFPFSSLLVNPIFCWLFLHVVFFSFWITVLTGGTAMLAAEFSNFRSNRTASLVVEILSNRLRQTFQFLQVNLQFLIVVSPFPFLLTCAWFW